MHSTTTKKIAYEYIKWITLIRPFYFSVQFFVSFSVLFYSFIYLRDAIIFGFVSWRQNDFSSHKLSQSVGVFFCVCACAIIIVTIIIVAVIGIFQQINGREILMHVALIIIRNSFCHTYSQAQTWLYHKAKNQPRSAGQPTNHSFICVLLYPNVTSAAPRNHSVKVNCAIAAVNIFTVCKIVYTVCLSQHIHAEGLVCVLNESWFCLFFLSAKAI